MAEMKLTLEVVTPERQVLHEDVGFVQMPGRNGYLGILPGHAPLLTELGLGFLSFEKAGVTYYATAMGGFAEVLGNRIILLAERSELAEEIDVGRARAAEERALKRLEEKKGEVDFNRAQLALQRALIRIQVAPRVHGRAAPPAYARDVAAPSHETSK